MTRLDFRLAALVALALTLLAVPARAQDGSIEGTVTSDGDPLPGATVVLLNVATSQERVAVSGSDGSYEFSGLNAGQYRVTASLDGFADSARTVRLGAGQSASQDFAMLLGAIEAEVTVTAVKGQRAVAEVPQAITIVSAKEIEDRQYASAQGAIERAPNVRTIDNNPARARPQFRGLSSSRVLLLIDGERLNNVRFDAGATGISPGMVDIGDVQSIEVVGGAGSGIYGTDAMAGVINVVTKRPTTTGGRRLDVGLDLNYNENSEYQKALGSLNSGSEKFTFRASYSQFEMDGWEAGDGEVTLDQVLGAAAFSDAVAESAGNDVANTFAVWDFPKGTTVPNAIAEGFNASFGASYIPNASHAFHLRGLFSQHEDLGLPFSVPPFDPTARFNTFRDFSRITAEYERFNLAKAIPRVGVRAYTQSFSRPQDDIRSDIVVGSSYGLNPDRSTFFTGNRSEFVLGREQATLNEVDSTGLDVRFNIIPWSNALLTTGVSYLKDESEDTFGFRTFDPAGNVTSNVQGVATTPNTEYENQAFYAALEWAPVDWLRLTSGLRYDEWDTEASPTQGYPPAPEIYVINTALPQILANPGDIVTSGINGVDQLLNGTNSLQTSNDVWTGNLGLTFPTPVGIYPFVRWGESYREPEVTVRYLIRNFGGPTFSVVGLPNTTLEPEEGETLDYGFKVERQRWRASFTVFENDLENFIGTILSPSFFIAPNADLGISPLSPFFPVHGALFFQRVNFSEVEIEGWELSAQVSIPIGTAGSLTPYLTWGETETRLLTPDAGRAAIVRDWFNRNDTPVRFEGSETDVPFGDTVPEQGMFGVRYTDNSGKWFVEYELRTVDTINRVDPDSLASINTTQFGPISSLDGYDRHTLRGGYDFDNLSVPFNLRLAVENFTDEFYFEPFQLAPAPGRSLVFGLSFDFDDLLN